MPDPHDAYEGTDALAHALGATGALFQQLRKQLPDVPEHILAFLVLTICAAKARKSLGPTVFRKRWYHMSVTARAFAEVLANPVPDDTTGVLKDMLDIYHRPVDDPG
jgi:hypothetical protein